MKIDFIDIFMFASMFFFWYCFYPAVHTAVDMLFYLGIPMSGFMVLIFLKIKDYKEEKTNAE